MRKTKEILRLRWGVGLGVRQIGRSLSISHSTVVDTLRRADAAGLKWPLPASLDDAGLEARLYPGNREYPAGRPEPDWKEIHEELRDDKVTLRLLWTEYKRDHPDGYQYSGFCRRYRQWCGKLDTVLRQTYRPGEKMFVDYAGEKVPVVDPKTGEVRMAEIFVAVLGYSNYAYAEAQWSQELANWIGGHCRALEYMGGAPEILVPDNLKSAVAKPCRYEPDLNPTYQELAGHYGAVVIPARPRHPRDRAKVEAGVQVVERWILAALRHRTFFSLAELNQAIRELLMKLNDAPFQKMEGSRRTLYEMVEKAALKPLPAKRYEFAQWKKARVNIDYHVEVEGSYYSVPHALVKEQVEARYTATTVEILHKGRRVASHPRSYRKGQFVTDPEHRPHSHREYLEWTPERLVRWAEKAGENTGRLVRRIMESKPHPEQGYRSCLGIMRLGKRYGEERLEAASRRALATGAISYRSVKSILESKLDTLPLHSPPEARAVGEHPNLRGPSYYSGEGSSHA